MAAKRTSASRGRMIGLWGMILLLSGFAPSCRSAPSFNPKPSWTREESAPTVLASSCDPTSRRCWGWLPVADPRLDEYAVESDFEYGRGQAIHARDVDQSRDLWRDVQPAYEADVRAGSGGLLAGRLAKKDVFVSRGWNAGGMPFSVLYLSPRANATPPAGSQQGDAKTSESTRRTGAAGSQSASNQSSYKVSLRNGNLNQPRRHYSIIPQLFISYGWGPSGK